MNEVFVCRRGMREIPERKLNLVPLVSLILLSVVFVFLLVGAFTNKDGWAKTDSLTFGWQGACFAKNKTRHCFNYGSSDDVYTVHPDKWKSAGASAFAGTIISIIFVLTIAIFGMLTSVTNFYGTYKKSTIIYAVLLHVTWLVQAICLVIWSSITQTARDDLGASVSFAFVIEMIACFLIILSAVIMSIGVRYPKTILMNRPDTFNTNEQEDLKDMGEGINI